MWADRGWVPELPRGRGAPTETTVGGACVTATATGPALRVASIPAGHPYVRHLTAPTGPDPVRRLPDPAPAVADPAPGQWWPPVMLDPGWVRRHRHDFDLMHVHFGFESADPESLAGWCRELDRAGKPLVLTVHDLVNPHLTDQARYRALLDVLVPRADRLITLTPGAAAEIGRRWGRPAEVVPHPHLVDLAWTAPAPATRDGAPGFVVGVSVKDLRANTDPLPVLIALAAALDRVPDLTVRVDLHPGVLTRPDERARALAAFLRERRSDQRWSVWTHPRLTDEELWRYLRSLDLVVLPYRFGTHSGWLEACVDVGTGVLVPATGHYAGQHGHPAYARSADGSVDPEPFAMLVEQIRERPALATPVRPDRRAQRDRIARTHERIYRAALRGRRPSGC